MKKICFFCGKEICHPNDKSMEHVISNFLLKEMNIKNLYSYYHKNDRLISKKEYSKKKVPAHSLCNIRFNELVENPIVEYIKNEKYKSINCIEYTYNRNKCLFKKRFMLWMIGIFYSLRYFDFLLKKDLSISKQIFSNDVWKILNSLFINRNLNFKSLEKIDDIEDLDLNSFLSFEISDDGIDNFDLIDSDDGILVIKIYKNVFVLVLSDDKKVESFIYRKYGNPENYGNFIKRHQSKYGKKYSAITTIFYYFYAMKLSIRKTENIFEKMSYGEEMVDEGELNYIYKQLTNI